MDAGGLLGGDPSGWAFPSLTAQPGQIRGLLRTYEGVKALPARLATQSQRSLLQVVMRQSFLQSKAWQMENAALHMSHWGGGSGGSMV